jgi:UDP-glucuronate decarboxylase
MSSIIITGGAGFLGLNLLKKLIKINDSLHYIIIDNFRTSDKTRLTDVLSGPDFNADISVFDMDIGATSTVGTTGATAETIIENIDPLVHWYGESAVLCIYHLAGIASPPLYKKYPLETLDVGYLGIKNVLNMAVHYKCKVLYTSTSEVYGDALICPQREDYYGNVNPYGERSCYDVSKRIGETLAHTYINLYGLDVKIARLFNTYGPYMDIHDGRIVTELVRCTLYNDTLQIHGDGTQTRCLTYVDDTVDMLVKLMESSFVGPINIGSDTSVSINELVGVYTGLFGDISKTYVINDKDDPKMRKPDLQLNKSIIGDFPRIPLKEGLKRTFEYFDTLHGSSIGFEFNRV